MLSLTLAEELGKWAAVVDAAVTLALLIAAATPTNKDDTVVTRVANLWSILRNRR